MKNAKVFKNDIIHKPELTAFVREVVLPGCAGAMPNLDSPLCFFKLNYNPSPIHRWGVFAAEDIPTRRRVIEYTGQKIDAREVWRRRIRQYLYIFWLDQKWAIDGAIGGSGAEFINHSCNPNLDAQVGGGRIFFISNRLIKEGEELTLNYNLDNDGSDLPCSCGIERCRGIIKSENFQSKKPLSSTKLLNYDKLS